MSGVSGSERPRVISALEERIAALTEERDWLRSVVKPPLLIEVDQQLSEKEVRVIREQLEGLGFKGVGIICGGARVVRENVSRSPAPLTDTDKLNEAKAHAFAVINSKRRGKHSMLGPLEGMSLTRIYCSDCGHDLGRKRSGFQPSAVLCDSPAECPGSGRDWSWFATQAVTS